MMFKPKVIIFDFDGVLVDSVHIKTDAFCYLFRNHPQYLEKIKQYHLTNGGLSRNHKIKYIYKEILKEPLTKEKEAELCDVFHHFVMEKVVQAPFIQGAEDFLRKYHSIVPLYVVSGTPEKEMRDIAQRRGLNGFFRGVYGSPSLKESLIEEIIQKEKCESNDLVLVGDSVNDLNAAKAARVHFIAITSDKKAAWLNDARVASIFPDLRNLGEFFNNLKMNSLPNAA